MNKIFILLDIMFILLLSIILIPINLLIAVFGYKKNIKESFRQMIIELNEIIRYDIKQLKK